MVHPLRVYIAPTPRLDTVDQAERTATFMAAEKQNTASTKAATRLSAMAKNLGPDSEGEDEEVKRGWWGHGGCWGWGGVMLGMLVEVKGKWRFGHEYRYCTLVVWGSWGVRSEMMIDNSLKPKRNYST